MDQELNNSTYSVDLSYVKTPAEIIYDMSIILDGEDARNKRICLKLGNIDLNQSQILSIKSLINSINSTLSTIETKSSATEGAAMALGIIVSSPGQQAAQVEPEMTYKTVDEVNAATEEEQAQEVEEAIVPQEYNESFEEETEEEIPSTPREYEKLEDHEEKSIELITDMVSDTSYAGEITLNIPTTEEIKEELDTIFNSEKKLEQIFDTTTISQIEAQSDFSASLEYEEKTYTEEDIELESFPTKYIKQTIRSGQIINYEGNIVVVGDCHPGSEIIAAGDITVWGVLSGIAHAGSLGNERARVRALKMNAIQLRIAQCYARRPDSLNTVFVEKTNVFTPEEARIVNGEIVIFKIND